MSRCFPFPPPGYEKQARNHDADLLAKEKHKEKRHKKEKKDKEKREGKEKKDKERSKDKQKEKKDRKEKHEEKRKDEDKNKTSDEKRNEGRIESCNGELRENSHQAEGLKDSKLMEELGRRIRDEATGTGNQMVQNFIATNQRRNVGIVRAMEKETKKRTEGKDKDKQGDDRREEKHRDRGERRVTSNEMVRNINDTDQKRIKGIQTENKAEKRIEGKERINKDMEGDDRMGERHKDREREEKRSKGKDKDRVKEKKKEKEKAKEHGIYKLNKEQDKVSENGRADHIGNALNIKPSYPSKDSEKCALGEGNLKKRKELEINGFMHENEMRPNKSPRPASSSLMHCENGRKLDSCHISFPSTSDRQQASGSRKVEINKEHKLNGIVEAQPSSVLPRPSVTIEGTENGEAFTRSTHPDSKYLSQLLSIPKMDEWSDFDDQEWLFGSNDLQLKTMAAACDASETPQVWAEALQIESADVYALPYVIPY